MKKLLDIMPEERKKVTNLFFQNFFDGLGTSFFYAMGIFIFLGNSSHHDALHYYPLVFLIGGLLILTISPVYIKIESKARTDFLLYGLGVFVILIILISFVLLRLQISVYTGIALLILYQLVYYLRQTQFWGLSSLSFNVLQSKRLFSIVSAGDLPAKFLGYSLVFKLLQSGAIQPEQLIYFAVIAYLISFYFLRNVFKSDHHLKHSSHKHFRSGVKEIKFFGNHLIRAMAIMAFFIMFVVFIVDYSFTKVVMHKINDEDTNMYYLVSTILYASYGFASILKLFFTGKVFQNLGLKWTMVITPVLMLLLIVSTFILNIGADDRNWYYVRLFIFLYIGFIIFRDVIGKPIFLTLFQPLSNKMRLHGHNIVKGIAEPLGMVISGGLLLIYYGYFEEYRLGLFAVALVIPIVFWIISSVNVRKRYFEMLQNVINLKLLSGNQYLLLDSKTNDQLVLKLSSNDETEVLFALDHLKNYQISIEKIKTLFKHKNEMIRKAAWEVTSNITTVNEFGDLILEHAVAESNLEIKGQVYYLLGSLSNTAEYISKHFSDEHPIITENLLLGWANNKSFELPANVREIAFNYLKSANTEKYHSGLRLQKIVPTETARSYITKALESPNLEQRKSAIIGSFGFLDQQFFNRIIGYMNNPLSRRVVKNEMLLLGDEGIQYYMPLFKDSDNIITIRLIQIMGQIGGKNVVHILIDLLRFKNPGIRKTTLDTLCALKFEDFISYKKELFNEFLREIKLGELVRSTSIQSDSQKTYLQQEFKDILRRIFRILSLLYDPKVVRRIEEGVFSKNSDLVANSLETMQQLLKPEVYKQLIPLVNSLTNLQTEIKNPLQPSALLKEHQNFNKWTIARLLAEYGCDDKDLINSLKNRESIIIKEQLKTENMKGTDALRLMEKVIKLRKTSLFSTTPENILVEVAGLLVEERYESGETVFSKGDKGDCMYIIYSGKVKIYDGKSVLANFDESHFFGDLAMLDSEPRSASAITESESLLLRLDQEAIYELMNDRIEVAQGIINVLCQRIRNLNEKYVEIENRFIINQ